MMSYQNQQLKCMLDAPNKASWYGSEQAVFYCWYNPKSSSQHCNTSERSASSNRKRGCFSGLAATCSAAAVTRRLRSSSPRRAALQVSVVIEPVVNMEQMQLPPVFPYWWVCCANNAGSMPKTAASSIVWSSSINLPWRLRPFELTVPTPSSKRSSIKS